MAQRILVTAALPYANGPIHVGHLAGAYLPADVFCRYHRMRGAELAFICGSDEHGVAILTRARAEGVDPRELVERYHAMMRDAFAAFGMSFDYYGRTTSPTHHETSQGFFRALASAGLLHLETKEQLYDPEAKLFLADRFVIGTCPKCGYERAYGDQCERCGSSLAVSDLIEPRSALSEAKPVLRETTHWVLPLDRFQPSLEKWLETKSYWKPNVLGQVKSWLASGLEGREVTRDLPWGVPVPEDVAKAAGVDASGKVLYVWLDAPIGYVSATREWAAARGDSFERWWKSEDTRLLHFIGKDNIVFHTLMFPSMLMAHGGYVLPENVPANEFLNLEGEKISTSRGWAVWLHEALERFPADYLRYALLRMLPETRDADFTWAEFQASVNNELADNLGNFVNRTLQFCTKYLGGTVPELVDPADAEREVLDRMAAAPAAIGELIDTHRLRDATLELMALSRLGNKYFNDTTPWATRTSDPRRCNNTIHVSLQLCASLSILAEPFLPFTAKAARRMLALDGVRASEPGATGAIGWDDAGRALLAAGHTLGTPDILVRKVEDEAIEAERKRLADRTAKPDAGPPYADRKANTAFDDFAKLDLRVGLVTKCERVPKSEKLLRCEVDLGFEKRQILAGVGHQLAPDELDGKRVVVVANLAPRKMMGLESAGMLLMATDRSGKLTPITSDREPGSTVT
jgi:methionyl-tRNA synthetase